MVCQLKKILFFPLNFFNLLYALLAVIYASTSMERPTNFVSCVLCFLITHADIPIYFLFGIFQGLTSSAFITCNKTFLLFSCIELLLFFIMIFEGP